jgi:hypothetical protein
MKTLKSERLKLKGARTFLKKGTCSRTFFYILDREFGYPREDEEKAIDPLAGGILQQGYQCGMLWGACMAVGAEAYRRHTDSDRATALAIRATQRIMDSFVHRTKSIECEEITQCDFSNKRSMVKYMLSGKFVNCFKLAGRWAPEALNAAIEGLEADASEKPVKCVSCASELIRKMGGTPEEMLMVAGFAGGLGLSGNGCGALAAAVWMNALTHNRTQSGKYASFDPDSNPTLMAFYEETDYEMECIQICGRKFESLEAHTEFINSGGCGELLEVLAEQPVSTG